MKTLKDMPRVALAIAAEAYRTRRNIGLFLILLSAFVIGLAGWNKWAFLLPALIALFTAVMQVNIRAIKEEMKRSTSAGEKNFGAVNSADSRRMGQKNLRKELDSLKSTLNEDARDDLVDALLMLLQIYREGPDENLKKGGVNDTLFFCFDFDNEAGAFEIGCYLCFHIDRWHLANHKEEFRDCVVNYIVERFIEKFQTSLKSHALNAILDNRLQIYGRMIREGKEPADLVLGALTELVLRAKDNQIPELYNPENERIIIHDFAAQLSVRMYLSSYVYGFLPTVSSILEKFYKYQDKGGVVDSHGSTM